MVYFMVKKIILQFLGGCLQMWIKIAEFLSSFIQQHIIDDEDNYFLDEQDDFAATTHNSELNQEKMEANYLIIIEG